MTSTSQADLPINLTRVLAFAQHLVLGLLPLALMTTPLETIAAARVTQTVQKAVEEMVIAQPCLVTAAIHSVICVSTLSARFALPLPQGAVPQESV